MKSVNSYKTRKRLQQPPSSFADYMEEPTDEDIGKDFRTLMNAPLSKGGHFIFKSEKNWAIDSSQYSEFFTLNLKALSAAINCIPYNEYIDVNDKYFTVSIPDYSHLIVIKFIKLLVKDSIICTISKISIISRMIN
jgi:uncharacterized membrane protein YpjA